MHTKITPGISSTLSEKRTIGIVVGAAVAAVATAAGAHALVAAKTAELNVALTRRGGVAISVGRVDAGLTATVRLSNIRVGELFSADAFEARVAFGSLLSGDFGADEILVESPRLNAHVYANGNSELKDVIRRFAPRRQANAGPTKPARLRRIVVSRGELTIGLDSGGQMVAHAVELSPHPGGVRVVTGQLDTSIGSDAHGGFQASASFARTAFDLTLPTLTITRGIAVGGNGSIAFGNGNASGNVALSTIAISRQAPDEPIKMFARLDDHGVPRPMQLWLQASAPMGLRIAGDHLPLRLLAPLLPTSVDLRDAHASGTLSVARDGAQLQIEAAGTITQAVVRSARVDESPIAISPTITLQAGITLAPDGSRNGPFEAVALDQLRVAVAPATINMRGHLAASSSRALHGQLAITLDQLACEAALAAVPPSIRGPLDGLTMQGSLHGGLRAEIDLNRPTGSGIMLTSTLDPSSCIVTADPPMTDVASLKGTLRHTFPTGTVRSVGPDTEGWASIERISPMVYGAFTAAEDGRFFQHHGFDLEQIARSLEVNLRDGKLARGGSTISQQLIKNSFLTQRRSFGRKLQEAVLTWRLENVLSKQEILQRYLNIIELGPEIFGITAAARFWFDLPLRDLEPRQAAFLAALTSEPKSMTRRLRNAGHLDPASAARVDTILRAMRRDDVITDDAYYAAKEAPLALNAQALLQPRATR
ncbi:MAG: transglycosylase domain-containing protein [Kofleriaceae bacterium]|nr:transglycosylase domain-containing protein [Kofleriaceae bacterium]